jgi:hypothetical protein
MPINFPEVLSALRQILKRHADKLVVAEDTAICFRLEGNEACDVPQPGAPPRQGKMKRRRLPTSTHSPNDRSL